ncbi:hypothetical protein MHYP_G00320900 [Metynnis hypsauchen]
MVKEDPTLNGYEHYYDPQNGSGYLAWRLKTVQCNSASEGKSGSTSSYKGGPKTHREMPVCGEQLSGDECKEAMSLMNHSADKTVVKDKMKATFKHRQKLVHDPEKASVILDLFPRFLDTTGLVAQDFTLLFGEEVSGRFLAKWPTIFKPKIIADCKTIPSNSHVDDLLALALQESDHGGLERTPLEMPRALVRHWPTQSTPTQAQTPKKDHAQTAVWDHQRWCCSPITLRDWTPCLIKCWTNKNGEKARRPEKFECPPGWQWVDEWTSDDKRAVDEKEQMEFFMCKKVAGGGAATERKDAGDPEGWEFSSLISWKFHRKERSSDTIRRRRWRRKMAPSDQVGASAIFKLEGALGIDVEAKGDDKGSKSDSTNLFGASTPNVSCIFDRCYNYHLRVYVYQARNLTALDTDRQFLRSICTCVIFTHEQDHRNHQVYLEPNMGSNPYLQQGGNLW